MNIDNGNLRTLRPDEEPSTREVLLDAGDLEELQKKMNRVETNDTTSVAGKQLQKARRARGMKSTVRWNDLSKNEQRRMRQKLKK